MPKTDKPNILVIWGDDIGITNLSCRLSRHAMGGGATPIDDGTPGSFEYEVTPVR